MSRPRHFGIAPAPAPRGKPDHRGTLLTLPAIICAWAIVIGLYQMTAFVIGRLAELVAP